MNCVFVYNTHRSHAYTHSHTQIRANIAHTSRRAKHGCIVVHDKLDLSSHMLKSYHVLSFNYVTKF